MAVVMRYQLTQPTNSARCRDRLKPSMPNCKDGIRNIDPDHPVAIVTAQKTHQVRTIRSDGTVIGDREYVPSNAGPAQGSYRSRFGVNSRSITRSLTLHIIKINSTI